MRKKLWISLALLLVIPGLLFTVSCAKKTVQSEASVSEMAKQEMSAAEKAQAEELERQRKEAERQQELERQRRLEEERLREQRLREAQQEEARRRAEMTRSEEANKMKMILEELILFDFDRSVLTPVAQDRLKIKAELMRKNQNVSVIIEGHCDARGTNAYNLALGERRAEAAKSFLIDLGISASRMATISYGEERPFDKRQNEDAWALNRRAHFVIE